MTDWKLPWNGGCRCDRVRIRITAPPVITMACHCRGCQRMTASAFSLSILVPADGFAVVQGDVEIGGLHGAAKHQHCAYCKSWMFTIPDGMPQFVNVRATMLDDRHWFVPWVETSTADRLRGVQTGAPHAFPNIPEPEAWGPLVADFAARGPRPA